MAPAERDAETLTRSFFVNFLRSGGVDVALCGKPGNGTVVWPHCKYWAVVSPLEESCKVMDGSLNTGASIRSEDIAVKIVSREAALEYADHWATVRSVSTS